MSERPNNIRVRLPKGLSEHLHQLAEEQGVPINTLATVLLAKASRWEPVPEPTEEDQS